MRNKFFIILLVLFYCEDSLILKLDYQFWKKPVEVVVLGPVFVRTNFYSSNVLNEMKALFSQV